jgi:predicted HAD superfamily hydrolase
MQIISGIPQYLYYFLNNCPNKFMSAAAAFLNIYKSAKQHVPRNMESCKYIHINFAKNIIFPK